jgi:hypothetical protein
VEEEVADCHIDFGQLDFLMRVVDLEGGKLVSCAGGALRAAESRAFHDTILPKGTLLKPGRRAVKKNCNDAKARYSTCPDHRGK